MYNQYIDIYYGGNIMTNIGSILANQRKSLKISQSVLAQKVGIAQSTISYIEKGETNPTFDIIEKIVTIGFNMNLKDFFTDKEMTPKDFATSELLHSIESLSEDKILLLCKIAQSMK